jgi:hypothetical protein
MVNSRSLLAARRGADAVGRGAASGVGGRKVSGGPPMTRGDVVRLLIVICVALGVAYLAGLDVRAGTGLKKWLTPQTVLSAAGLIVGFVIVSWQLKRQHWNTLDNNRRQSQDRLKVELYSRLADRIEATAVPLYDLGVLPTAFIGELSLRHAAFHEEAATGVPNSRYFPQLLKAHQAAEQSVTALVSVLETYAIALSDHPDFGNRLAAELRSLTICLNDFCQAASQFAGSETSTAVRWLASAHDVQTLTTLAQSVEVAASSLSATVSRLRVAGQNALLGGLFPATGPNEVTSG